MRNVYLVTHTESQHHVDELVGGWYDTSLTGLGRRQAAALAERLAGICAGEQPLLISSDLKRARETAEVVGGRLGVRVEVDPDLREISQGVAGGKPRAWLDERMQPTPDDNRLDFRNVEGAETRREAASRLYRALDAVIAREAGTSIVVTHGFAVTFLLAAWIAMPLESVGYVHFPAVSGSITHLREDNFFRSRAVLALHETAHLKNLRR